MVVEGVRVFYASQDLHDLEVVAPERGFAEFLHDCLVGQNVVGFPHGGIGDVGTESLGFEVAHGDGGVGNENGPNGLVGERVTILRG